MLKKFKASELQQRLIKNSGFNFASLALTTVASFIISVIVARLLSPSSAGVYFYLVWLIGTLALLINLGLPNTLTRFVSEAIAVSDRNMLQVLLSRGSLITVGWGAVLGVGLLAFSPWLPIPEAARPYLWLVPLASISLSLQTVFGAALLGLQRLKVLAQSALIVQPLLVISLYLASREQNLALLIGLTGASYLVVALLFAWHFVREKILPVWPDVNWADTKKRFIRYGAVVSAITIIDAIVWQRSEIFFLGAWVSSEAVAFYTLGFGLSATAMKLVPGAFSGILLPTLTETHLREEKWVLRRRFYRATGILIAIVAPMVILGYSLAPLVIPLLYGTGYQPVIDVFRIVLLGSSLGAVASVSAALLYGAEKPGFILKFGLLTAVFNIFLNIYLIGNFGLIGAAWANTIAQGFGALGGIVYVGWSLRE